MTDARPLLLVYANCQGDEMHAMASRVEALGTCYEVERVFLGDLGNYFALHGEQAGKQRLTRVRLVWEQSSQASSEERAAMRDLVDPTARWLRFPALTCSALYPFSLSDTRPDGGRRFPYSDMLAARLWREMGGAAWRPQPDQDSEIYERYMALSRKMMPPLDRLLERDVLTWQQRDRDGDIPMTAFLQDQLRRRELFYTTGRGSWIPSAEMLGCLIQESIDDATLRTLAVAQAARLSDFYVGNDGLSVPVHPLVAERLRLDWYNPDAQHRWGGFHFDFREWILRCVTLADCL